MLEAFTAEQAISLSILALLAVAIMAYLLVRMGVQKKRIRRVAESDKALYLKRGQDKGLLEEMENVFATTPQVTGEITGFSIATVLLAITLLHTMEPGTGQYMITSASLLGIGLASVCFLMSMDQFLTVLSPSLASNEKFRLYWEATNLKTIAFGSLWASILLMMALVNAYAVLIVSAYTGALVIRHFELRWVRREN